MSGQVWDYIKLRRFPGRALPPVQEEHRGQIVLVSGDDSSTEDELHAALDDAGTLAWRTLTTSATVIPADQISGLGSYATFGPFSANDLAASATAALEAPFFNTATALSRSTPDIYMPLAGEIVGIFAIADANRTAGTATIQVTVDGATQTFDGGQVCALNSFNTRRHSVMALRGDGESVNAGQRVALQVVTSGWAPTTANLTAWFTVRFDA